MKERRKPSMLIAMIAMIAAIGLALSSGWTAYAAEDEPVADEDRVNALWPIDKDIEASPGGGADGGVELQEDLPASYRSDKELWADGIRVKDQNKAGICWAFSATSAAEYSYAKEKRYETTGAVSETSPGHLAFFAFNRVNDPLGNTDGDSMTILPGEDPWPLIGGNSLVAMQHLATWSGLGLENDTPFAKIDDCILEIGNDYFWDEEEWEKPGNHYDDSSAYNDVYTLQNSEIYWLRGDEGHDELKNLVHEYGAVSVSIDMNTKKYLNADTGAFYKYEGGNDTDHAVTVVGWDDDYHKENFADAVKGIPAPQNDGAWVVQNSWGDEQSWPSGDDGFFYVSYESVGFTTYNTAAAYDMQPADTYAYNFQYDGTPGLADSSEYKNTFFTDKGTWAANVFTNTTGGPIALDAVGMTTYSTDTSKFTLQVYTGLTDADDPTGGYRASDVTVTTSSAGVKTVPLPQSVTIGPGEKYAIVFCFDQGPNKFGVEVTEQYSNMGIKFNAATAPHQSFFSASNSSPWVDMDDYNACFRIKGLANDVADPQDVKYTVAFMDGFGGEISTQQVVAGQSATPPADPKRDGYVFKGWKGDYSRILENTVITATWEKKPAPAPKPVKITPKVTLSSASYTYDGKVKTPSVTVKDGSKTISKSNYTVSYPSGRKNAGTYRVKVTLKGSYSGSGSASFTIKKAANTLTVKGKTAKVKYAKLKKKKQTLARAKVITVTKPVGKVTYSIATVKLGKKAKAKYRKQIKMNKTTGKITLKKGMKKGVYQVTAKVTAAGSGNYKPVTKSVVFKIRVK